VVLETKQAMTPPREAPPPPVESPALLALTAAGLIDRMAAAEQQAEAFINDWSEMDNRIEALEARPEAKAYDDASVRRQMDDINRRLSSMESLTKSVGAMAEGRVAFVEGALTALRERVAAVDTRAAVPGPVGPAGPVGPSGPQGLAGKDGVNGKDGAPGLNGKDGEDGLDGRDGIDGADGAAGKAGVDGKAGEAGAAGRDGGLGPAGLNGKDGAPGAAGAAGKDGRDGIDGLGFEDLAVEFDGQRTIALKFLRGLKVRTFPLVLPFLKYQGVYQQGKAYDIGDTVTWGNSLWHCNETTIAPPGEGSKLWQLCVRKGRDGKDGKDAASLPVVAVTGRTS
jgi:hypothetical protein